MVQPLHIQDNLSKMPLMQKFQEMARAVPEAERDQFAKHLKQERYDKTQRTEESKETEKKIIRERQKKEKNGKKKKHQLLNSEEGERETESNDSMEDHSGSLIDIIV